MSNYKGYKPEDNARRKANNTGDVVDDVGPNKNAKSYSSKPGQLSASQQVQREAKYYERLNKMQPVKYFTPEEMQAMNVVSSKRKTS